MNSRYGKKRPRIERFTEYGGNGIDTYRLVEGKELRGKELELYDEEMFNIIKMLEIPDKEISIFLSEHYGQHYKNWPEYKEYIRNKKE